MIERTTFRPPRGGERFFLQHSALAPHGDMWEWQCPWCSHSIAFIALDRRVAEVAARSHVLGSHGMRLWDDVLGALRMLRASHGYTGDDSE